MEKQTKFYLTLPFVGAVTLTLLVVPFMAMQYTDEVRWGITDFCVMGALLFGTGSLLVVALRSSMHIAYRAGMVLSIGNTFLLVWANLATGLIGSGPDMANLMYAGVPTLLGIGVYFSKFTATGLQRTMMASAFAVILIGIVALLMGVQHAPDSSVKEIIGVSLFFAIPYGVAGLLFRFASFQRSLI